MVFRRKVCTCVSRDLGIARSLQAKVKDGLSK